jgi:hypothetical protein
MMEEATVLGRQHRLDEDASGNSSKGIVSSCLMPRRPISLP